jgi:nucleoid DNA-binding protein
MSTLNQLVAQVAKRTGIKKPDVKEIVEATFDQISDNMEGDDPTTITGFGRFKVNTRKARMGRNPATGEEIAIAEKRVIKFTPAKQLKERLI